MRSLSGVALWWCMALSVLVAARAEQECKYDFKVYVYPLPEDLPAVQVGEEARAKQQLNICQKCIFEQFALEFVVTDFLTQFCGRTMDPEEADFFYLPLTRDAEYRVSLGRGDRNPSTADLALMSLILKNDRSHWERAFQVPLTYWDRHRGADHILVMPAPVTNFMHETNKRGFFHYMFQIYRPIFLNVEFSESFIAEYPVCAGQKDIVMPYPTTDYEVFNGHLASVTANVKRDRFMFYQGGNHGSCTFIRTQLNNLTQRLEVGMKKVRGKYWRETNFRKSVFCPIPVGDSPSSKRMYDVMHLGCIPVVLSDDLVWAFSKTAGGVIDPTAFSIQIPQQVIFQSPTEFLDENKDKTLQQLPSGVNIRDLANRVLNGEACPDANSVYVPESMHDNTLVNILRCVSAADVAALQEGVKMFSQFYRYYADNASLTTIPTALKIMPDGAAIEMMAKFLSVRKKKGIDAVADACDVERKAKHKYIDKYPCVKPKPHQRRLDCSDSTQKSNLRGNGTDIWDNSVVWPHSLTGADMQSTWSFRRCPERCSTPDIRFFERRRLGIIN